MHDAPPASVGLQRWIGEPGSDHPGPGTTTHSTETEDATRRAPETCTERLLSDDPDRGDPRGRSSPVAHPSFTEAIDRRTGAIRATGRPDTRAADMLSGIVRALHQEGFTLLVLVLDLVLDEVQADAVGVHAIESLTREVAARGGHVSLLNWTH